MHKPLLRSGIREELWELLEIDPDRFKREVRAYFALAYPGWGIVKVTPKDRIVWLKDER